MATDKHATMDNQQPRNNGSDLRFLCGLSQGNNGAAVFYLRSVSWKCFLCGLFTGYITKGTSQH
jgi:hypothetical protein